MVDYFYIMCLDERDSPNLHELSDFSKGDLANMQYHRHFGLCGAIFSTAEYPEIIKRIRRLQMKFFKEHKPLHYQEILNNSGGFSVLGSDKKLRDSFTQSLNYLISTSEFYVMGSFIDKHALIEKYGIQYGNKVTNIRKIKGNLQKSSSLKELNLYNLSLKFMLQNYYKFLENKGAKGLIIAEARGKKEDAQLVDEFYSFQNEGAGSLSGEQIRTRILDLLVVYKSQNHVGSQIADLITYPIYDNLVSRHSVRNDHVIDFDKCIHKKIYKKKGVEGVNIFP